MRHRSNSYGRKKLKVNDDCFTILNKDKYIQFLDYDYNVKQLKCILKSYNLKSSGNKNELMSRIYKFMKETYFSVIIQKYFRRHILTTFYSVQNRLRSNKHIEYNNTTDFYSLEGISEINPLYLYTYKDEDNFNYVFKISSLISYFDKNNHENPYNRNAFTSQIINDINIIKRIYKLYSNICEIDDDIDPILTRKQQYTLQLTEIFHTIDSLGNYSDINWILNLSKRDIVVLIRQLYDLWSYRAQLTEEMKREICPPNGRPFYGVNISALTRQQDHIYLLETCITIFSNMLNTTATQSNKSLAALYILSALTIVSPNAADTMPWLYQSISPNIT